MTTRVTFRRELMRRLQQPFARRIGTSSTATSNGTTTTLIDTVLAQADDFWNGQYIYFPAADVTREISDFATSTDTVTWLEPVSATSVTASGVTYEIWSQFTAGEVNDAINAALRKGWPDFFNVEEDYLVICSDTSTRYSLTGLSLRPKFLGQVWMEGLVNATAGQVTTAGTSTQVIDATRSPFASTDVGKTIRVYEGTSKGDRRTILTYTSASTVVVSAAFTTTLDTTSKFLMVDENDENRNFSLMTAWDVDDPNYPATLTVGRHPYGFEGYLLKLLYESEYADLTAESDSLPNTCPLDWLTWQTLCELYVTKLTDSASSEQRVWATLLTYAQQQIELITKRKRLQHIHGTIIDVQRGGHFYPPEYPF